MLIRFFVSSLMERIIISLSEELYSVLCEDYCVIFNTWEGEYYGFIMNILCHYSPLAAKLNKPFYCECIIKCRNTIYHAVKM